MSSLDTTQVASWAHLTNAHPIPGDGIVTGLASVGLPLNRGLLLLAEMSSAGTLATGEYTAQTVAMARRHPEFVMGFVAMRRVDEDVATSGGVGLGKGADFIIMTPGVGLDSTGDGMGQQYRTPDEVIRESGSDVSPFAARLELNPGGLTCQLIPGYHCWKRDLWRRRRS